MTNKIKSYYDIFEKKEKMMNHKWEFTHGYGGTLLKFINETTNAAKSQLTNNKDYIYVISCQSV